MSTIATQAAFDALLQTDESRYEDDNTPTQINTAITMAPGTGGTFTTLRALTTDTDAAFTGDNCWINFNTDNSAAQGNTSQPTPTGGHWGRGPLSLRNSILTVTGELTPGDPAVNFQWPGWANPGATNRYTADFTGAFLRHSRGDGAWTLHFGGAAAQGNSIGGATLSDGVIAFAAPGQFDWIGVVFGPSTTQSFSLGQAYYRWNRLQDTTLDARWDGYFGCDLRGWTDTTNNTHHIGSFLPTDAFSYTYSGVARNNNTMRYYYYDIIYSPEIIASGIRANTRTADVTVDLSFGATFNPLFRDAASLAQIADVEVDLGTGTVVYAAPAPGTPVATVKNTHLTQMALTDGNAILRPSDHSGFLVEQAFYTHSSGLSTYQVPGSATVAAAIPASNFWSYTHECYNAAGDVNTITPTAGTFETAGIFRAGTEQLQDLNADGNLSGVTLTGAANLRLNGAANLDEFYPALKSYAYNTRSEFFRAGIEGSSFVFRNSGTIGTGSATFTGNTATRVRIANSVALGDTVNTIEARGATCTISDGVWPTGITLRADPTNSGIDLNTNVTLAAGTTFDGEFTGLVAAHLETGQTITGGSELTLDATQGNFDIADITVTGTGNISVTSLAATAPTVRVPADVLSRFTGTNVNFVALPAAQFARTVTTPAQQGIFGVRNVTSGTIVVAPRVTTTASPGTYTIPAGDTDTYRFYYKQQNTPFVSAADPGQGFFTTIIERSNSGLTANTTETIEATEIFSLLYSGDASIGRTNQVVDAETGSTANRNSGFQIQINNPDTNIQTTAGASQYQVLSAMDTTRYMQALLDNGLTTDIISPPSSGSVTMSARYVQLNTATGGQQQRLVGAEFNSLENFQPEDLTRTIFRVRSDPDATAPTDAAYWELQDSGGQIRRVLESWGPLGNLPVNTTDVLVLYTPGGSDNTFTNELRERVQRRTDEGSSLGVGGTVEIRNSTGTQVATFNFSRTTIVSNSEIRLQLSQLTLRVGGVLADATASTLDGTTATGPQQDQIVQLTGTVTGGGSLSVNSVNILPNPAGATPTQIQDAASAAITNAGIVTAANNAATHAEAASVAATSNLAVSMDSQNAVGYILGTDGDTRLLGIKPRAANYDSNTNYRGNVTGE